jgi:hypothetical protein
METSFNEEYIGQVPEFDKIAELFDAMIVKARKTPKTINPNNLPENKAIEKIFKKFFGFKAYHLYWIPSDTRNAFTFTSSMMRAGERGEKIFERKPGHGFYDTEHQCKVYMMSYAGLLLKDANLTGKEFTAIFLHEIGHNCDWAPFMHMNILTKLYLAMYNKKAVDYHNEIKDETYKMFKAEYDKIYNDPKERKAQRERDDRYYDVRINSLPLHVINGLINLTINITSGTLLTIPIQLLNADSKKSEQFADSFAVAYGLGPELMSGLGKLGDYSKYVRKTDPLHNLFRDFDSAQSEIYAVLFDCHSSDQQRCKDCIVKLRKDLKSGDYPPEMKSDLLDELHELENEYNQILSGGPPLVRGWRRFIDIFFGGRLDFTRIFGQHQM